MKKLLTLIVCFSLLVGLQNEAFGQDTCATAASLDDVLTDVGTTDCTTIAAGDVPITTINADLLFTDSTPGTDTGTGCSTQGADGWYSWTATTPSLYWQYQSAGGDPGIYVYSGACGALTEVDCLGTFSNGFLGGWAVGDALLIQVHDFGTTTGVALDFCLNAVTAGCTDNTACNFDPVATVDDGTCELPGDACDDGDACTGPDVIAADCSCAGAPIVPCIEGGYVPCDGCNTTTTFLDSGGSVDGYSANELETYVICPDATAVAGAPVTVTFTYVDMETGSTAGCWDGMTIYDGPDATATSLGLWCSEASGDGGTAAAPANDLALGTAFTSTDASGCLTFVFDSDGSVQETGWEATVDCGACIPTAGTWGLIILSLSLLSLGLVMLERKEESLAIA